jgi:hypothetical protein
MRDHWLNRWWVHALFGVLWLVLSVYCWCRIREWEANPIRPNPFDAGSLLLAVVPNTLYWIGGKWLVFEIFQSMSLVAFNAAYLIRRGYVFETDRVVPHRRDESREFDEPTYSLPDQTPLTSRSDFILHVLGRVPLDLLPIQLKAASHVLAAIDTLDTADFLGDAESVLWYLEYMMCQNHIDEDAMWMSLYIHIHTNSRVLVHQVWSDLIGKNSEYARYAVDAAYLDHDRMDHRPELRLATLLSEFHAWAIATERIVDAPEPMQAWWNAFVAPQRSGTESRIHF